MNLRAIIEIPQGLPTQDEHNVPTGAIRLDCVLYEAMHYLANEGFVCESWASEADPLNMTAIHFGLKGSDSVLGARTMQEGPWSHAKLRVRADVDRRLSDITGLDRLRRQRLKERAFRFQEQNARQGLESHQDVSASQRLFHQVQASRHAFAGGIADA